MSGGELWRERRFRTVYCAEHPETSLREVLADLRPNLAAREAFADAFGVDALTDLPPTPVTARWREEHLLVAAGLILEGGDLVDLTEPEVPAELEGGTPRCSSSTVLSTWTFTRSPLDAEW